MKIHDDLKIYNHKWYVSEKHPSRKICLKCNVATDRYRTRKIRKCFMSNDVYNKKYKHIYEMNNLDHPGDCKKCKRNIHIINMISYKYGIEFYCLYSDDEYSIKEIIV